MKCLHCEYENGWNGDLMDNVNGEKGEFYKLPVSLERESYYLDRVNLIGCPACKKTFIGESHE